MNLYILAGVVIISISYFISILVSIKIRKRIILNIILSVLAFAIGTILITHGSNISNQEDLYRSTKTLTFEIQKLQEENTRLQERAIKEDKDQNYELLTLYKKLEKSTTLSHEERDSYRIKIENLNIKQVRLEHKLQSLREQHSRDILKSHVVGNWIIYTEGKNLRVNFSPGGILNESTKGKGKWQIRNDTISFDLNNYTLWNGKIMNKKIEGTKYNKTDKIEKKWSAFKE